MLTIAPVGFDNGAAWDEHPGVFGGVVEDVDPKGGGCLLLTELLCMTAVPVVCLVDTDLVRSNWQALCTVGSGCCCFA